MKKLHKGAQKSVSPYHQQGSLYTKNQFGRSMVEMLGVLAVVGVLSIGAIAGYSAAMEKHKINQTFEGINMLAAAVKSTFAGQDSYDDLGYFSSDNSSETGDSVIGKIYKEAGINIPYPIEISSEGGLVFSMRLFELSQSECIAIYTKDWSQSGFVMSYSTEELQENLSVPQATASCESSPRFLLYVAPSISHIRGDKWKDSEEEDDDDSGYVS